MASASDTPEQVRRCMKTWLEGKGVTEGLGATVNLPDHRWIIAVDFGTDGTGYAVVESTENETFINKTWDDGPSPTYKTKTCILLDAEGEFVAFGSHAQTKFLGMEPDEAKRYLYFEDFKMSLYKKWNDKNASKNSLLTAANGRTVNAHTVFAAALGYIKRCVEQYIKSSTGGHVLQAADVFYVLTVPAIWSEDAKHFMRECVYEAGLIDREDPDRLLLALEPEAAGIYCRSLPASNFVGKEGRAAIGEAIPGDSFVVVDAGGGTVDIVVHEIDAMGNVKEVHQPTGGPWGGKYCNDGFFTLLTDIFGKDVINYLEKNSPVEYADMVKTVEDAKRAWRTDESMQVKLNCDFRDAVEQCGKSASGAVKKYAKKHDPNVTYFKEKVVIGAATVKKVLDETIDQIIKHLRDLLTKTPVKEASRMFLVGGFAESKYLQHKIMKAFHSKLQVLIPLDGGVAVMKGAIQFGRNPSVVRQRIARFTYGLDCARDFVPGKDAEEHKVYFDGIAKCKDVFLPLVKVGEPVSIGQTVKKMFKPGSKVSTRLVVGIFYSQYSPEYITDEGVKNLGSVEVKYPSASADLASNKVNIILCFGLTEIHVLAAHLKSGESVTTRVDFTAT